MPVSLAAGRPRALPPQVAFDEKSPFELLEIVNLIMANLSDDHKVDLRDETPEATANRMMEFLRVLNFKQTMDPFHFKQGLLRALPALELGPPCRCPAARWVA